MFSQITLKFWQNPINLPCIIDFLVLKEQTCLYLLSSSNVFFWKEGQKYIKNSNSLKRCSTLLSQEFLSFGCVIISFSTVRVRYKRTNNLRLWVKCSDYASGISDVPRFVHEHERITEKFNWWMRRNPYGLLIYNSNNTYSK